MRFQKAIEKIFGSVSGYSESGKHNSVDFSVEGTSFSYENLSKLSELLNTTKIRFDTYNSSGGCSTCDYGSEKGIEISATEVRF